MTDKIKIELKGIPQTLLLPLLGRALFSQKPYSPIHDQRAIQLVNTLDFDFAKLKEQAGDSTLFWMARAYQFDKAIRQYLQRHPYGTIVNLGAGLETAFYRVDNGTMAWIDLDLPEVIELRRQVLPPPVREKYIAKSILDFSWMDEIKHDDKEIFFFAGGFFMYFTEEQVRSIITAMAMKFPRSELIFDTISKRAINYANKMLEKADMKNAVLQWGIDNAEKLEMWSDQMQVLYQIPYFKHLKTLPLFPLSLKMKMWTYDLFNSGGIVHIRFNKESL